MVISLGDWNNDFGFLNRIILTRSIMNKYLFGDAAIIMVVPSFISNVYYRSLLKKARPYGVEVIGDPGAIRHIARGFLKIWSINSLKNICAGALAASFVTEKYLQSKYPCPNYSVGVSDVWFPNSSFVSEPRRLERLVNKRTINIITVGTLALLYKGQDILIESVKQCLRNGLDINLVIVGDGKYKDILETRVKEMGLSEKIHFCGQLSPGEAILRQLDNADIFVLPSRQEGLPRVMLEAMARGLPCIGSTAGGIPELLPSEDMVPPSDSSALSIKIAEVISDHDRMVRMSARNLNKAKEFKNEVLQGKRIEFYECIKERTIAKLGVKL